MEIFKQIEEIRSAKEQSKLVIFVGAGVSVNSGLPSWEELVRAFSDILGYASKKIQHNGCEREHFCDDEFRKIPQYVYNRNKTEYLQLLESHFGVNVFDDKNSNPLHDLIFEFSPAHIITTNYDPLIEKCESSKRKYYTVVSSDKELLEKGKSAKRFILKMHGDYRDLENIVLKEDDYLRYEQERVLICNFIKSLLINHTFLFVGYSINDYNFKQIIDWIEYLSEQNKAERDKMPMHFVIRTGTSQIQMYERKYLEEKRIELLNTNDLSESYIEQTNVGQSLTNIHARQLYATMNAVIDPRADIIILGSNEALLARLKVFNDFKYIPYLTLEKALNFKGVHVKDAVLEDRCDDNLDVDVMLGWHRLQFSEEGSGLFAMLKDACETEPEVVNHFLNAHFHDMYLLENSTAFHMDTYGFAPTASDGDEDETHELFSLYLNNEYSILRERVNNSSCRRTKAYYNALFPIHSTNVEDIAESLKSLADFTEQHPAFLGLLNKINWFSFSCDYQRRHYMPSENKQARQSVIEYFESLRESEQDAFAYIYDWLINSKSYQQILECSELLKKQEAFYSNPGFLKTNPYDVLSRLAGKTLCFYNFMKLNHVILDNLDEAKRLFWMYARAVLITYKPQSKTSDKSMFMITAEKPPVRIDAFALDIIVKYSQYELLREYIVEHRLLELRFTSNHNAVVKFSNLCASKDLLPFIKFDKYFKNFSILLRHCELSEEDEEQILNALDNFETSFLILIYEDALSTGKRKEFATELLLLLASFKHKQKCVCESLNGFIMLVEDNKKTAMAKFLTNNIYYKSFQPLKDTILEFVEKCENSFGRYDRIRLIVDGFLPICESDVNDIKNEVSRIVQKKSKGLHEYPDYDKEYLEICMILILRNKIEDISFLESAKEKYPFLKSIFEPENFDVAEIRFSESIWREFFETEEYREKLRSLNNNEEKIKVMLVRALNNGSAGFAENQIFFRYFWKQQ